MCRLEHYSLGLYEKAIPIGLPFRDKLKAARMAGSDFVELSIDETPQKLARLELGNSGRMGMIQDMHDTGIAFRSMCLSGHRKYPLGSSNKETEARGMEIMKEAIELADDLGIRIIQLAGYDVYYEAGNEDTRRRFAENICKSVEMAAAYGIVLGFETMETEFMNTVEKAMSYVRMADSSFLTVYPDLGNITNAAKTHGIGVEEDIRSGKGHLCAMHLKETKPGVFREVPFGKGHVDFENGIRTAWECGIRRYVTEFWDVGRGGWEDDLKQAADMMRGILDRQLVTER